MSEDLSQIRRQIDVIDIKLCDLINSRVKLAKQIAKAKLKSDRSASFYHPDREAKVLRAIKSHNANKELPDDLMLNIFREIMSACLSAQKIQKIAFLGPFGTFTQEAVFKHFGKSTILRPVNSISEIFSEVKNCNADFGVVPAENSTQGAVNYTLDCFRAFDLYIVGEVEIKINHQFLVSRFHNGKITKIYAHEQALEQCRIWLDRNFPEARRIALSSSALAAQNAQSDIESSAIASSDVAKYYDLDVLHSNIQDGPTNSTRFLVISRQKANKSSKDKTSLLVYVKDEIGALLHILDPFKKFNISITNLQTRPGFDKWSYVFYVDVLGHIEDDNLKNALCEIKKKAIYLKILGSYPVAI